MKNRHGYADSNNTAAATSVILSVAKDLTNIPCALARSLASLGMTGFL